MGIIAEAVRGLNFRGTLQGPEPITSSKVYEWLTGGGATVSGVPVSPEGALRLSVVWSVVDLVSRDVARTPVNLYEKSDAGRTILDADPRFRLLHDRPNPHMTAFALKQTLQGHRMLRGNAFANIEYNSDGEPVNLWPLRPDRMDQPTMAADGSLLYIYHLPSGEPVVLRQVDVLHLRGLSSDGIWGYSPITLHREAVGLALAQKEYQSRFYSNDASARAVLQVQGTLSDEAHDRMAKSWSDMHQGLSNSHRIAILEEGVEYKQIGMTARDSEYVASSKLSTIEIGTGIFHVPPHKYGEMDRATFSNIEEQDIDYEGGTLDAEFALWEQECNRSLLREAEMGRRYIEFNRNALVRATIEKRYEAYDKAWFITPNEKREMENRNKMDGLDEVFIPVNNVLPLSVALKMAQAQQQTGASS